MDYLAQACIFGRFQAQELVSTQDERRPICLACWKSLKFVKYIEILERNTPGLLTRLIYIIYEIFIDISFF